MAAMDGSPVLMVGLVDTARGEPGRPLGGSTGGYRRRAVNHRTELVQDFVNTNPAWSPSWRSLSSWANCLILDFHAASNEGAWIDVTSDGSGNIGTPAQYDSLPMN